MAPKRKTGSSAPPAAAAASPRRTRSATAGKRVVPPPAKVVPEEAPPKKAKRAGAGKGRAKASEDEAAPPSSAAEGKTIIVEACKQCNSFKTRAITVKEGLESALPAINVTINPEKPRRGCFEIRDATGEIFISLLNMPRPFKPMKALDMDQVIKDIVKKIS